MHFSDVYWWTGYIYLAQLCFCRDIRKKSIRNKLHSHRYHPYFEYLVYRVSCREVSHYWHCKGLSQMRAQIERCLMLKTAGIPHIEFGELPVILWVARKENWIVFWCLLLQLTTQWKTEWELIICCKINYTRFAYHLLCDWPCQPHVSIFVLIFVLLCIFVFKFVCMLRLFIYLFVDLLKRNYVSG